MKVCDTCHSTYPTDFSSCPKDQSPLRMATELMQGMIIRDKYEIVGKIGAGGMATVYRARHLVFNEPRAIKVVSSRMMDDENFLKRFRNEAVITRKLQHPNAVRVDDVDTTEDGRPCMIMELVEGKNLRATIEENGALPSERALNIARQAALALAAAHRLGITHRDIKPDNIVLVALPDGKDMVKVLDFGIAKLREESGGGVYTATQTGMVIGTPQYISPEQAVGKRGDAIDGRADLYSLGVVLYEMLTGRLPFESDTPIGLLLQHMQTAPRPPREIRPDLNIPEPVSAVLMKCLEKDPAGRFQSAEELISALQQPEQWAAAHAGSQTCVMGSDEYPAPAVATVATTGPRTIRAAAAAAPAPALAPQPKGGSTPNKWIGLAVMVVALIGGSAYFLLGRSGAGTATNRPAASAPASTPLPATSPAASPTPVQPQPATTAADAPPDPQTLQREKRTHELLASGRRHMDGGEYDQAIRDLQKALEIEPGNTAAQAELKRAQQAKRTEEQILGRKR